MLLIGAFAEPHRLRAAAVATAVWEWAAWISKSVFIAFLSHTHAHSSSMSLSLFLWPLPHLLLYPRCIHWLDENKQMHVNSFWSEWTKMLKYQWTGIETASEEIICVLKKKTNKRAFLLPQFLGMFKNMCKQPCFEGLRVSGCGLTQSNRGPREK